jgi:quinol monooxygenase YgiN
LERIGSIAQGKPHADRRRTLSTTRIGAHPEMMRAVPVRLNGLLVCADDVEAHVVRAHLAHHVELTRAEPGCLSFAVEPTADPLVWTVAEEFTDAHAFAAHQARVAASTWGIATTGIERRYVFDGLH